MKVNVNACQQQTNVVDCGVFAIANMFHILAGADIGRTKIFVEDFAQVWETLFNDYFGMNFSRINFQEATIKRCLWRSIWLPLVLIVLKISFYKG